MKYFISLLSLVNCLVILSAFDSNIDTKNRNKLSLNVNMTYEKRNRTLIKRTLDTRAQNDKKVTSKSLDAILNNAVSGILASMNKETKHSLNSLENNRRHKARKFKRNHAADLTDTRTHISTRQLLNRRHGDPTFEGNGELLDPFDGAEPTVLDGNLGGNDNHESFTNKYEENPTSNVVDSSFGLKSLTPDEKETMKKLLHSEDNNADIIANWNMKASSKAAISKSQRTNKANKTGGKYDYLNLNVVAGENKNISPLSSQLSGNLPKYDDTLTDDPEYDIVDEYNKYDISDKKDDEDNMKHSANEETKVSDLAEGLPMGGNYKNNALDLSEAVNDMQAVISTTAFQKNASVYKNVSDYEVIVEKSVDDKKHIDIKEPDFSVSLALNSSVSRDRDVKTLENVIRMLTAMKFRENGTGVSQSSETKHKIDDAEDVSRESNTSVTRETKNEPADDISYVLHKGNIYKVIKMPKDTKSNTSEDGVEKISNEEKTTISDLLATTGIMNSLKTNSSDQNTTQENLTQVKTTHQSRDEKSDQSRAEPPDQSNIDTSNMKLYHHTKTKSRDHQKFHQQPYIESVDNEKQFTENEKHSTGNEKHSTENKKHPTENKKQLTENEKLNDQQSEIMDKTFTGKPIENKQESSHHKSTNEMKAGIESTNKLIDQSKTEGSPSESDQASGMEPAAFTEVLNRKPMPASKQINSKSTKDISSYYIKQNGKHFKVDVQVKGVKEANAHKENSPPAEEENVSTNKETHFFTKPDHESADNTYEIKHNNKIYRITEISYKQHKGSGRHSLPRLVRPDNDKNINEYLPESSTESAGNNPDQIAVNMLQQPFSPIPKSMHNVQIQQPQQSRPITDTVPALKHQREFPYENPTNEMLSPLPTNIASYVQPAIEQQNQQSSNPYDAQADHPDISEIKQFSRLETLISNDQLPTVQRVSLTSKPSMFTGKKITEFQHAPHSATKFNDSFNKTLYEEVML